MIGVDCYNFYMLLSENAYFKVYIFLFSTPCPKLTFFLFPPYCDVISHPPALPENPECTVSEDIVSGDISSVTVSCSTTKVYPQAICSFYRKNNVSLNQ